MKTTEEKKTYQVKHKPRVLYANSYPDGSFGTVCRSLKAVKEKWGYGLKIVRFVEVID